MLFIEKQSARWVEIPSRDEGQKRLEARMYRTKVRAYAKINLTLEIVGREDGFHLLDSLVASVDVCDTGILKKRKGRLSSIMMYGQGSESIPPEKKNPITFNITPETTLKNIDV